MKTLLYLLLLIPSLSFAGSGPAFITGVSDSGRTKLEMEVQDISGGILKFKLTIDGESYTLMESDFSEQNVTSKKGPIYKVVGKASGKEFTFTLIRHSFKALFNGPNRSDWKFRASLIATDPRKANAGKPTPKIILNCRLKYSI